jgi:hypothetical protein
MNEPWPLVPLGEVLREERQRIGTPDADALPLLGVSNVGGLHRSSKERIPDMSRYFRVERDWFAYNPMRINVGSVGWAEREDQTGVISPDYVVFSCTEKVLPRLVYLFLKGRPGLDAINLETAGSVRERLYFDALSRIHFPLPPLAEQRRIVGRIQALAERIGEAMVLREEAAAEAAVTYPSALGSFFSSLVQKWPVKHLGDLCSMITDGPHLTPVYVPEGVPFVTVKNMVSGKLDFRDL